MKDKDQSTMSARYLAGFAVVVSANTRRLLLLRSRIDERTWKLPGGTIEQGEDPISGIKREIGEELSSTLQIGATLITRFEQLAASVDPIAVLYAPTLVATEIAPKLSTEHDMYRWVAISHLSDHEIDSHLDQPTLRRFLAGVEALCCADFAGTLKSIQE